MTNGVKFSRENLVSSKYDDSYAEMTIGYAKRGFSKRMIARELGVVCDTLDNWGKRHPEFADALSVIGEYRVAAYEDAHLKTSNGEVKGSAALIQSFLARQAKDEYGDPNAHKIDFGDATQNAFAGIIASIAATPFALMAANPPDKSEEDEEQ